MDILDAFDLTRCAHSAATLAGVDAKTVGRYVAVRDNGGDPYTPTRRTRVIDPFVEQIADLVETSRGRVRADVVHRTLVSLGYSGTDRTTRRAVAEAKVLWLSQARSTRRPWMPEPGKWLQFGWSDGPHIADRRTRLFCGWLPWSRFQVVLPSWEQTLGTLAPRLDTTLRHVGGAPAYLLTRPVRPEIVAAGRHYGCKVEECEPFDPGGDDADDHVAEIAETDLAPTRTDLMPEYDSFVELTDACERWSAQKNACAHPDSGNIPDEQLRVERRHLQVLPSAPFRMPDVRPARSRR